MTNNSTIVSIKPSSDGSRLRRVTTARLKPEAVASSKTELVLKKLRSAKGATLLQLCEATGWQAHSVRGFLSATVKKKLGLDLASDAGKDGIRRYRVVAPKRAECEAS